MFDNGSKKEDLMGPEVKGVEEEVNTKAEVSANSSGETKVIKMTQNILKTPELSPRQSPLPAMRRT